MLDNVRITRKLPAVMISFALVSALLTGLVVYKLASDELAKTAREKLSSLLDSRKSALEAYFTTIEKDLKFHSNSSLVVSALNDFSVSWQELPGDKTSYLQKLYIDKNPYSENQKDAFLSAGDDSRYSSTHTTYHPAFRGLLATRDFYDLFLINRDGMLIYSVVKELDFATNLLTGKWKGTALASVYGQIHSNPKSGSRIYSDFSSYEPSDNSPASFIGAPVFDENKNYMGALIFQMPITTLNSVMQVTAGMGETGETYLVGDDLLMRSDSRFMKGRSILKTRVDTQPVRNALEGKTGVELIESYRGHPVYSAYGAIEFKKVRWAILAEINKQEVLQPIYTISWLLLFVGLAIVLVIFLSGWILSISIAKPIVAMTDMLMRLARNELDINIAVSERDDELGGMAKALSLFKRKAVERDSLQKKLSYMAHHDQLTGLPTRKFAMSRLKSAIDEAQSNNTMVAVMFADIDNFKPVNDNLGHHIGDELIKSVAQKIRGAIRKGDTVGRVGGDEFIIIVRDLVDPGNVEKIANKISAAVNSDVVFLSNEYQISISLGIALYPIDSDDTAMLVKHADKAMYVAKQRGKNNVYLRKQA